MFLKIVAFKNLANFTGKHLCWSLFLIKLYTWGPETLLKRDSNTDVFLRNLPNFWKHLFYKTLPVAASVDEEFIAMWREYQGRNEKDKSLKRSWFLIEIHWRFLNFSCVFKWALKLQWLEDTQCRYSHSIWCLIII